MTYNLKNLEITKEKKANEALMALKLLEIQKKVMGIPADGQTSPANNSKDLSITMDSSFIETMKKNDYVASLIRTAMEADTASKNAETDIKYLKEDVEALTANVVVDEKWEKYVKKTIQEISSDLKIWTEILTRLDNEFMKVQLNDVIKSDSAPESFAVRSKNYYVLILLFGLIPLIAAILAAFVKEQMFAA